MKQHITYIATVALLFTSFTVIFNFFPRSTVSELERRELASFPQFSWESLRSGAFTNDVSTWYSDSEPYRDLFMSVSMAVSKYQGIGILQDDHVTFHAAESDDIPDPNDINVDDSTLADSLAYQQLILDENTKIANAGIIIVGTGDHVRALMAYGGNGGGEAYARAANTYKATFGSSVNVYCMVIPTAISFYCPEKVRNRTRSELSTIENVASKLDPGVYSVNVYHTLAAHAAEDIYLRTDHHWAPLGAYYAAKEFARIAHVPFKDISEYDRHVVHRYVGSMYGYSKDISVKNAPEDFVYWTPRGVTYTTTYINYSIDQNYQVTGESRPCKGQFFYHYKDGSGGAYCTFMGGDTKITFVKTSTKNGRRLLIIKDSFGNAIPGWLFGSFEEIVVVDGRYFTKNMVSFVEENNITDILFANNSFKVYSPYVGKTFIRYLSQKGGIPRRVQNTDTTAVATPDVDSSAVKPVEPTAEPTPTNDSI